MNKYISHSWDDETPEAKARWFQSLSLSQRMEVLCSVYEMILQNNPRIMEFKNAEPTTRSIRILRKSSG
ncbi:MAG: hypothetical protein GWN16_14985 [Calditrichae bacterium]|nr:hypothetical protein [Calditrichia bacterium]